MEFASFSTQMKPIGEFSKRLDGDRKIYRIELLDRFEKILKNEELVFAKPSTWIDPLENLIFNAKIVKDGKEYHHPIKEKIFSQCWSLDGDSYALWQIYTTKKNDNGEFKRHYGVRIETILKKLNQIQNLNEGQFYFGQVTYLWKYQIEKLPKEPSIIKALRESEINDSQLETLLFKRKSYRYENEVRLLAIPKIRHLDKQDDRLCRLKIKPTEFISSIRFDPSMSYREFKSKKEELIELHGFKPNQITKSTYFNENKFTIEL